MTDVQRFGLAVMLMLLFSVLYEFFVQMLELQLTRYENSFIFFIWFIGMLMFIFKSPEKENRQ